MNGDSSPERPDEFMRECPGASPREASAQSEVTPPLMKSGLSLHRLSEQTGRLVVNMEPLAWHHTKQTPF